MNQRRGGALSGDLSCLSLTDVLQVLALGHKTGTLSVESEGLHTILHFQNGQIVGVEESGPCRRPLNEVLEQYGRLSAEQTQRIRRLRRENPKRVDATLVELGVIARPIFEQQLRLRISEALARMFQWRTGQYSFDPQVQLAPSEPLVPCNVEALILDAVRAADEWQVLSNHIPGPEGVPKQTDISSSDGKRFNLSSTEMRVLTLANGRNTIRNMAELLMVNELEIARAVYTLLCNGLVMLVPALPTSVQQVPVLIDMATLAGVPAEEQPSVRSEQRELASNSERAPATSSGLKEIIGQLVEQAQQESQMRQQLTAKWLVTILNKSLQPLSTPVNELPQLRFLSMPNAETPHVQLRAIVSALVECGNGLLSQLETRRLEEASSSFAPEAESGGGSALEEVRGALHTLFARTEEVCPELGAVQLVDRRLDATDLIDSYVLISGDRKRDFYREVIQGLIALVETILDYVLQAELTVPAMVEECRKVWEERKPVMQTHIARLMAAQKAEDQRAWDRAHPKRRR